jgi:hypothetical protein
VNVDGRTSPDLHGDFALPEPYVDENGNGRYDAGEKFSDLNGNKRWDLGNPVPYALADMHNHCMRQPDEEARHAARVAAGLEDEDAPTWRLLLDRMVQHPERYHNAIVVNLHGELLPMPPARNVSDAARDPENHPGWRAVTHPERLRPLRVPGDDALSVAPRFRVYAYKTEFHDTDVVMPSAEPFVDENEDGVWEHGEAYEDLDGDGDYDADVPISLVVRDGDFSARPNAATSPTIRVRCLSGGVDSDGVGGAEPYADWRDAPCLPEAFDDQNHDGIRQVAEPFLDLDGDAAYDVGEPFQDLDGDGAHSPAAEALEDRNGNGRFDPARPEEPFEDADGDGVWDAAEPFWDLDEDGKWTRPRHPRNPWRPWSPADLGDPVATAAYVDQYGEPFLDLDGDKKWTPAEAFLDTNGNGVRDGGYRRGEMFFEVSYDADLPGTVLRLHGTPLETPYVPSTRRGLPTTARLYDLDYVPCPTPATAADADRFARSLYTADASAPKNTARWTVELPLPALREAFETSPGARDGDQQDHVIAVETRIGRDQGTGVAWPTRHAPTNRSRTYAWFCDAVEDVPFSERFQFQGDPRHSPYADTDRTGTTAPNGYNWYFDDLADSRGDFKSAWLALDGARLRDRWLGRGAALDVPRLLQWLRQALVRSEAVYTTLTGWSYYYLSVGGDVGSDAANGFPNSIPMDGTPFGLVGPVFEDTITDGGGTSEVRGSLKLVRENSGGDTGIRSGGAWWSKPWLGELCPDGAYAGQWVPWGNLRAATGAAAGRFHLIRRGAAPSAQQPRGTTLSNAYARLAAEGCTSVFNIGTSSSTFHHQGKSGQSGTLVDDGPQLSDNYHFPLPTSTLISRPFGIDLSGSGGVGDEFGYTDAYPRFNAQLVRRFYDHQSGLIGSGLVRLREPGATPHAAHIVVNGVDNTLESGSAFIARYALLSLLHGFLAAGDPAAPQRIAQLPRVEILHPTLVTDLDDPETVTVRWRTTWTRWDGLAYTAAYPPTYAGATADLLYVPMVSRDGGTTWASMLDGEPLEPDRLPRLEDGTPDPAKTRGDLVPGGDEVVAWATPAASYPEGSYLIRVEVWRGGEALHHALHVEKVYVYR